jgi:hypothetical protein
MTEEPDWDDKADEVMGSINLTMRSRYDLIAEDLRAAYALGKSHATEWRPIADAPDEIKDGRTILAWDSFALEPTTIRWIRDHWESCWDGSQVICSQSDFGTDYKDPGCPTHYMPIPPAPEAKE